MIFRWLSRNGWRFLSATDGEPVILGGISPSEPERVERHFNWMAERDLFGERLSSDSLPRRIGPIESGRLTCTGVVDFCDGLQQRRMRRERAYRALYLMPDGRQRHLFSLQACGNQAFVPRDNYTWESDKEGSVVVPAPEPRPAATSQTSAPAAAETSSVQKTDLFNKEDITVVEFGPSIIFDLNGVKLDVPLGATFSMKHEGNSLSFSRDDGVVIRTADPKLALADKLAGEITDAVHLKAAKK